MHIIAQVLSNEALTPQIILTVLGIVGTLIGGWAYRQKQKAEAEKLEAQAKLKQIEGEAAVEQKKADTMDKLIVANQQFNDLLRQENEFRQKDREKAEGNYRVFTKVSNDNAQAMMERLDIRTRELMTVIREIPDRVSTVNSESTNALVQQLGEVIVKEFALQRAERTMHPFPASEDHDWRDEYIIPTSPNVQLYKQPVFDDDARLHKPCATIRSEGERVRLISGRLNGWLIIDKSEGGERCWGWLPEYAVKAGQPESITT